MISPDSFCTMCGNFIGPRHISSLQFKELIGVIGVLIAGMGTIISSLNGSVEPSNVGLAVTYTLTVSVKMVVAMGDFETLAGKRSGIFG